LQYHNRNDIFPESRICGKLSICKIQAFNYLYNSYQKQIKQSIRKIYKFFTDSEGFRYSLLLCWNQDVLKNVINMLPLKGTDIIKL